MFKSINIMPLNHVYTSEDETNYINKHYTLKDGNYHIKG